jgi:hypothetical protein
MRSESRDQMIRRLDQEDPALAWTCFVDYVERAKKVDQAMAWTAAGLCSHCGGPVNESGECMESE